MVKQTRTLTLIEAYDAEDASTVKVTDDGANFYGIYVEVIDFYGNSQCVCIPKRLLAGLCNEVLKLTRGQERRALPIGRDDDYELTVKKQEIDRAEESCEVQGAAEDLEAPTPGEANPG